MAYKSSYLSKSTYPRTTKNWDYDFQTDRNRQTSTIGITDVYGGSRDPLKPSRVENLARNATQDHTHTTVNDPERDDRYVSRDTLQPSRVENLARNATRDHTHTTCTTVNDPDRNDQYGSRDPLQPSKVENIASNATRDHTRTTVTDPDRNDQYESRDPLQPSRFENLAWNATLDHTTTPMDVDTFRPKKDQSELDQLLALVKQLKTINMESILKVLLSGTSKMDQEKQKADYEALKESHESLSAKYTEAVTKSEELVSQAKEIIKETKTKAKEELDSTINHYKSLIKAREDEIKCLKSEKDSALSRLSKEMGDKLSENNTGIADLSDPNRSTNLAEKYNSLYDNEWTDALEILSKKVDEEAGVRYLLEIKKHIYSVCNAAKAELLKDLTGRFANPISGGYTPSDLSGSQEDKEIQKMLETCLKIKAKTAIPNLQKSYLQMISTKKPMFADRLPEFVNKCIEICWLMNIQSPPLVFGELLQAGQSIDRDQYKEYTKQGDVVSFVVWLPLLIEKDGVVLSKGVVQPVPYSREKKTATIVEQLNTRSRSGTQAEGLQSLLNDTGGRQDDKKIPPDGKPERTTQNSSFEQRVSDLRNENGHNKKILVEQPMQYDTDYSTRPTSVDAQVDELFEKTRTRTYSHNIASVTSAPSVASPNDNNTSVTTFSGTPMSFQLKTTNNYAATTSTTNVNDRPHTSFFEQMRKTKDSSKQPAKSSGVRSSGDANTTTYLDPARTEYYSDNRHTYAFSNGKVYVQDSRGGWRFTKDLTGKSNA